MVMVGAAPDDLDRLAALMERHADQIDQSVRSGVGSRLHTTNWRGRDAEGFRQDWNQRLDPKLRAVAADLRDAAATLRREAGEQRQASSVTGPGSGAGFGIGWGASPGQGRSASGVVSFGAPRWPGSELSFLGDIYKFPGGLASFAGIEFQNNLDWDAIAKVEVPRGLTVLGGAGNLLGMVGALGDFVEQPDYESAFGVFGNASEAAGAGASLLGKAGAARVLGGVGGMMEAGADFTQANEAYVNGDYLGFGYNVLHGSANSVGAFVPVVGASVAAWDLGYGIGTLIAESPPAQSLQDDTVSIGQFMAKADGTDVVTRYQGVAGAFNMAGDHSVAVLDNVFEFFGGDLIQIPEKESM